MIKLVAEKYIIKMHMDSVVKCIGAIISDWLIIALYGQWVKKYACIIVQCAWLIYIVAVVFNDIVHAQYDKIWLQETSIFLVAENTHKPLHARFFMM